MYSTRPYQAYPFVVGFPTTPFDPSPKDASSSTFVVEVGIFFSILLFQLSIFYFFLPEALWCCSLQPVFLFCQDRVLFLVYAFNRSVVSSAQVLSILSSFISLFNRSAARIGSSLFLFSNGGFSTFFIFVVFFLSICSTSQGSWFNSFVQEAT